MPSSTTFLFIIIGFAGLTGCYERVVSERPFAGMAATRSQAPTGPDYSQAQADLQKRVENRNKKPFDPIGDWIFKPIGGVAQGIGNAFSSDEPAKPATSPARPVTSAGDVSNPPPAKSTNPPAPSKSGP
jgi:hypothetical protein